MTGEELRRRLCEPFNARDVEWRVTKVHEGNGLAVPYITSRAIQNRLDDVVGPFNWRPRFIPWHQYVPKVTAVEGKEDTARTPVASQLCGLSIYDEERKAWIEKIDGAENTDFETIKGGISDSFKRAAVLWGVGRYLYAFDAKWVKLNNKKIQNPAALITYYQEQLAKLGLATATDCNAGNMPNGIYCVSAIQPAPIENYPNAAWVQLVTPDQHVLQVFYAGAKPGLVNGVNIKDAKFVQRNGAGGLFYELQDYQPAA